MEKPRNRTAVVQDWFFAPGGSEQCAIEFARLLPSADVITSFFEPEHGADIDPARVTTWPFQRLFGPTRRYRSFLPFYPLWFSTRDLRDRDLVISSSSAFAKAVRTRRGALHVSYIHTPMRYAWDLDSYVSGSSLSLPARIGAKVLAPPLRRWDRLTAKRPDVLVANSIVTRDRIRKVWDRDSIVIHPPVNVGSIPLRESSDGFLLVAARMLAYRRLDLAVSAATRMGRGLVMVGDGPEEARLREMAGPTVTFLGRVDRATLVDLFSRCQAYLVPGIEDFGIAPVEAQAAGRPVVAFRGGGALETVVDGRTGVYFDHPTTDALVEAIHRVDTMTWDPAAIRTHAETFDIEVFRRRWRELLASLDVDPTLYRPD